jgi:hypothetical protein
MPSPHWVRMRDKRQEEGGYIPNSLLPTSTKAVRPFWHVMTLQACGIYVLVLA